ncbi:hypothetical protein K449DRAFT_429130 [Hypoxylon sp. EC38]|nr:hypothetical protein K449DRAFT_429130 [Hypoxylon sp. EC38]
MTLLDLFPLNDDHELETPAVDLYARLWAKLTVRRAKPRANYEVSILPTTNPTSNARLLEKQGDMDYYNPSWARFFLEQIHLKMSAIEYRLEFLESSISKTEQDVNHLRETYARDEDEKCYWLTRVHAARRAIQDHRHFLGSTRRQLSVRRRSIHDALWAMEVLEEAGRVQAEVSAMYRAMNMCQQLFWDLGDEDVDVDAPHFIVKNYILELENLSSRLIST